MRPSEALNQHRDAVYQVAARYRVANPRVFGSALRGDDQDGSDLDLLVDTLPGTSLLYLRGLLDELRELLGIPVDALLARYSGVCSFPTPMESSCPKPQKH